MYIILDEDDELYKRREKKWFREKRGREGGGVVEQQSNLRVGSTGMSDSNREKRTVLLLIVYSGTLIKYRKNPLNPPSEISNGNYYLNHNRLN